MSKWKWVRHEGSILLDVGVNPDGTLHNPNGYPDELVRSGIAGAEARRHERRREAAVRAAETRRLRQERKVYDAVRRIASGELLGPRRACFICGRGLDDPDSKRRGIGSDCWQSVLAAKTASV